MKLKIYFSYFFIIFVLLSFGQPSYAADLAQRLSGKILLQVESVGEAWYINPLDLKRYYLGRPSDAFELMRSLGLGVSELDYERFQKEGAERLKGRILLRVRAQGEAYYVNPSDSRLYYLGRPSDAFEVMRRFGLGIKNDDLEQIVANINVKSENDIPDTQVNTNKTYRWRYRNQDYSLDFALNPELYQIYQGTPRTYSYYLGQEPEDIRDAFYSLFLQIKDEDQETLALLERLKQQADDLGLSPDERAAFVLSFVQYLDYDYVKAAQTNTQANYPFETLYLQRGICSDTTFLAVLWLRELGYGAAILDFPDSNHSAVGIACPLLDSLNNSGYCYVETTNYFPIGVVPAALKDGQAQGNNTSFDNLFSILSLGRMEIKQATKGRIFQGVAAVKREVLSLKNKKENLDNLQSNLDLKSAAIDLQYNQLLAKQVELQNLKEGGNISAYNQMVPLYNDLVADYQAELNLYQAMVLDYNQAVADFNSGYKAFYQQ
jgi:hypothetical protein